jgi:hypothetical protein
MNYIIGVFFVSVLLVGPHYAISQTTKAIELTNKFESLDDAAQATFRYLAGIDTNNYCRIVDIDCFMEVLKKQSILDSSLMGFYLKVSRNRSLVCNIFKSQFDDFRNSLGRHYGQIESFEYIHSKVKSEHKENFTADYTVEIASLVNKRDCRISIHVTMYNKKYFVFEPVEGFLELK